jgi:hypothetical protein
MLALAPRGDVEALTAEFARRGRIRIGGVLTADGAATLTEAFEATDWRTVLNQGARHFDLHALQVAALDPAGRDQLAGAVAVGGREGFQYLYDNFPLFDAARAGDALSPVQRAVVDLLSGAPFLDLMRAVTGETRIAFADMQMTRYRPGHFLARHDDDVAGKGRLFAYVLSMTTDWRADWGGVLNFFDAHGDIAEGFTPAYNALALFRVPQPHAVSMVTPFAARPRYAITGWLRA